MEQQKIRILVAKPGLDGHDRGALVIAQGLRDQGMEVVYTGLRQTPAQIVAAAIQEDVDCIGLSCLSGAHNQLFPEVVRLLKEEGAEDILVIGGGVIPAEDIPFLEEKGIARIFTSGTSIEETAQFIREHLKKKHNDGNRVNAVQPPQKIDHIGIAVKSIDEALPFYRDVLGLRVQGFDTVPTEQVRIAFIEIGDTRLELLEAADPSSPIARFIEKKGEGIHHIAYRVQDINQKLEEVREHGLSLIHEKAKPGAHGSKIAFLHPRSTAGVLTELCQPGDVSDGGGNHDE